MIEIFRMGDLDNFEARTEQVDWLAAMTKHLEKGWSSVYTLRSRGQVAGFLGVQLQSPNHFLLWSTLGKNFDIWAARTIKRAIDGFLKMHTDVRFLIEVAPGFKAGEDLANFLGFYCIDGVWMRGAS